jgi:hypothetical protein
MKQKTITYGSLNLNTYPPGEGNATAKLLSPFPEETGLPPGFAKLQQTVGITYRMVITNKTTDS